MYEIFQKIFLNKNSQFLHNSFLSKRKFQRTTHFLKKSTVFTFFEIQNVFEMGNFGFKIRRFRFEI